MKKLLSIVLCLFLLIAMGTMVFAADNRGDDVVIGENEIVVPLYNSGEMGRKYVVFIAPATATYTFTCTSEDGMVGVRDEDGYLHWMDIADEPFERTLLEGQMVEICVWSPHSIDESYPDGYGVTFTVETDSLDAIYADWYRLTLGENVVDVPDGYSFDGLPTAFCAPQTGIYRITTTHDNAYVSVDGANLEGAGMSHELTLRAGSYLEILVATYDMDPGTVSFTIEAVSVANTQLQEGVNNIYVSQDRALYGLECKYLAPVAGVYEVTAISENALVAVGTSSWIRVGESIEVTLAAEEEVKIVVADAEAEEATVVLSITLKEELTSHEHEYDAIVIEPSCSYQGYTTYKCKICGESYDDDYVDATGEHVYTETANVPATCTEDGYITIACMCGLSETTVLPMTGHVPGETIMENEVTGDCTTDASYDAVVCCESCGEELSRESIVVTAPGHQGAEAVRENEVAATCADDGAYDLVVYCQNCGVEMSRNHEVVKATGAHVYATETDRKAATCTEDGYVTKACGCGASETTTLPKTGHDNAAAVKENEKAATCTEDGSFELVVYCKTCNAEISRETTTVPASGHKEAAAVRENEVHATCGTDGSYDLVVYCQNCNAELSRKSEIVKSTGEHVYANVTERVEPTCTEDGYEIKACGCGAAETFVLTATGHIAAEAVKDNEIAPTCTQDGSFDMVVYCSVCGEELSREATAVPSTGEHVYANETERQDATCTAAGYVIMACGCGETQTTELPMIEHTAGAAMNENEVAVTCTTDGSYDVVIRCSACEAELERSTVTVSATGHSFGEWTTAKEPTATEEGTEKRTCACGEEETRSIPALGEEPTEPETKPAETKPAETKPAETKPATEPTEPVAGEKDGSKTIVVVIIAVAVVAAGVVAFVVIKKKK